ncbi:J domain-containing protein [Pikeienuella piscinae]|uniref:J domain-containing protein n=1 Tax=Pikeienuella piscinae TaxID=2748098 RepID=A0A7L5BT06_9RHOB|nr:J domain-containing protein [Pikeienuella piscinae]QIE54595.1 J domain-containing protein [Pikeienuella piscinae]
MSARSPLDYDISVTADKRRRARTRGLSGEIASEARKCDWSGCSNPGLFRAPKSREELNEYRWFCQAHIRDFNKSWNYYEGWSEAALDSQRRAEFAWERPTWRLGQRPIRPDGAPGHADGRAWARWGFQDPLEVLGENATINPGGAAEAARRRTRLLPKNEQSALEILGCTPDTPKTDIRRRYRALVKDLHPDMKGGAREDEDRLRDVVWAWDQIKGSRSFR